MKKELELIKLDKIVSKINVINILKSYSVSIEWVKENEVSQLRT